VKQKVFRIEKMLARGPAHAPAHAHAHDEAHTQRHIVDELKALHALAERREIGGDAVDGIKRELTTIREALARNRRELGLLIDDGRERRMARAAEELRASVDGMDHATQKILSSVEQIDDKARALTSSLKSDCERGMAQDIQDYVVQIYEACNFQDLAGQRISNVLGLMVVVEDQIADALDRFTTLIGGAAPAAAPEPPHRELLNGPKLDDDNGHASQSDIDALFD
jgi:chemotaxis protein CheZ